jgi:hypothetical protein
VNNPLAWLILRLPSIALPPVIMMAHSADLLGKIVQRCFLTLSASASSQALSAMGVYSARGPFSTHAYHLRATHLLSGFFPYSSRSMARN